LRTSQGSLGRAIAFRAYGGAQAFGLGKGVGRYALLARRITMLAPDALANVSPERSDTTEPTRGSTVLDGRSS
jgi:hypothetical protein